MGFKRMDGFVGCIPQKFIDNKVKRCPMCGTNDPNWKIDKKMGWINRYLFLCEKCECIISSSVPDVTGFGRTPLTTLGFVKMLSGKKTNTIYMKIEKVGNMQLTKLNEGKEVSLEELNEMAQLI